MGYASDLTSIYQNASAVQNIRPARVPTSWSRQLLSRAAVRKLGLGTLLYLDYVLRLTL